MEYFISKVTFRESGDLIHDAFVYEFNGTTLNTGESKNRDWLVNKVTSGFKVSTMTKSDNGTWVRGNEFNYQNNLFTWGVGLPKLLTKRKTFVSYYHQDDQEYRETFEKKFEDIIVSKSVEKDDINSDNSDEYIKQLIQKEYLSDTTVLVVLIGPNTKNRKHVDWEIAGALNLKVGDTYSGLLGILLPSHPDYGTGKINHANLPKRFAANLESGYAILKDWTNDRLQMQNHIEEAFAKRAESQKIVNKAIPQMERNT